MVYLYQVILVIACNNMGVLSDLVEKIEFQKKISKSI